MFLNFDSLKQFKQMKFYTVPILLSIPLAFAQGQKDKQAVEQLDALVVESSPLNTKVNEFTQGVNILEKAELDKARGAVKTKKRKTITDQVAVARMKAAGRGRGSRRKMPGLKFSAQPRKNIRDLMPRHFKNRLYP